MATRIRKPNIMDEVMNEVVIYGGFPVRYSTMLQHLQDVAKSSGEKNWLPIAHAGEMGWRHWRERHPYKLEDDVEPLTYEEFEKVTNLPSGTKVTEAILKKWITIYPKDVRAKIEAKSQTKEAMAETVKAKPKPHKEIGVLQSKPTKQSDRGVAIDRSLLAKQVVAVDDSRWLKRPNRFDVRGVDTPQRTRHLKRAKHNVRPSVSVGR